MNAVNIVNASKANLADAVALLLVSEACCEAFLKSCSDRDASWLRANGFTARLGEVMALPDAQGGIAAQVAGWGNSDNHRRTALAGAMIADKLPAGTYRLNTEYAALDPANFGLDPFLFALGWGLSSYRFDRYKKQSPAAAKLLCPDDVDCDELQALCEGAFLTQDLINTPTADMGPSELAKAAQGLAKDHNAEISLIEGEALLKQNFPMIHAVGRAASSDRAPRLIDLRWGDADAPKVTLVGKGVCFDTGGLNIKPGNSMLLMKKDMGGAATALGLAQMIMAMRLKIRLRVLIPAVENAISGDAFRPKDILKARNGLTVEVNHTDAEGRLVLADALAYGGEEEPDLMICLATLTGAARVALGADLPPFYTANDALADKLQQMAMRVADPVWRLPLWPGYEKEIEPGIADLDNAPGGGMAGSITAALFLNRFAAQAGDFVHFDLYGWTPAAKPGRPKGGACQSARLLVHYLREAYA